MTLSFIIPGEPQGKGRPRLSTRGGFARAYTPAKTRTYEALIEDCAVRAGANIEEGPVAIVVIAIHGIPKSWSKSEKAGALAGTIRPTGPRNDCDNVLKAVSDALNGVAYKDDGQVVQIRAERHYGRDPQVMVEVSPVDTRQPAPIR